MKRNLTLTVILFMFFSIPLMAQPGTRKEVRIPDIPGYLTLKCDFHIHTVFSDGLVWPTVRVEEAWLEGLDVIAITDHIEYLPYKEDINIKFGRAYEIAKPLAENYGLILIQAAEITRDMPPGHFNCLFLKDVPALDTPDFMEAIGRAMEQGAFIMWNHPGWKMENDIPVWYNIHTQLLNEGRMHGIEVVNERNLYPLALKWSMEKNIPILGSSDIHSPTGMFYDLSMDDQRTMTLVFAKIKSEEAVRDALFNGRTAVYTGNLLIGKAEFLEPIFHESVKIISYTPNPAGSGKLFVQLLNQSEVPFTLVARDQLEGVEYPAEIILYPERTVIMEVTVARRIINNSSVIRLPYTIQNLMINAETGLPIELEIPVSRN